MTKSNTPQSTKNIAPPIEPLTFEESQKMVQFEVNGVACRWNITEPLEIVSKDSSDEEMPEIKPEIPSGKLVSSK